MPHPAGLTHPAATPYPLAAKEPKFFVFVADNRVDCELCPHRCTIQNGSFGACGVRGNKNGKPVIPFYGFASALALDPIEKKPLYHFMPGSKVLSVGFVGCNLHCPFCQNWRISQHTDIEGRKLECGEIVSAALRESSPSVAYTYSEPLVHAEFLLDCMALAHTHGLANVLVSNGCVNGEAAKEILSLTDAANIDLKSFSAETYAKTLGGGEAALETVLAFIQLAHNMNVHIEITTLVVPGLNDSEAELDSCAGFIAEISADIPWHLSAYHPDYRWNAPPAAPSFLERSARKARQKLRYVYTGNIPGEENNTPCPHCGSALVRRRSYRVDATGLTPPSGRDRRRCATCGKETPIIG